MSLRSISKKAKDPHEEVFEPHEEISDVSEITGKATPFVYTLVVCICIGGFLFGYDTGGKVAIKRMGCIYLLTTTTPLCSYFGSFKSYY